MTDTPSKALLDRADDLMSAIEGTTDQFEDEIAALADAVSAVEKTLAAAQSPTRTPWGVHRLADDPPTYGPDAGKAIVVTGDGEIEVTGIVHRYPDAGFIVTACNNHEGLIAALNRLLHPTAGPFEERDIGGEEAAWLEAQALLTQLGRRG
jgi:hypothetical protein